MRALITGITGFVGRYLVPHLVEHGDQVIGISRTGTWPPEAVEVRRLARLEALDLADVDDDALDDFLGRKQPEVIYHLAAQSNPARSLKDPRGTWAVNLGGALNLLEAVKRLASGQKPRVVLISSGVCYGNPAAADLPVSELCPLRPNNPYAASKAAADLMALQYHLAHGTDVVVARPFNHAGPGQSDAYVLSSLCRQVAEVEAGRKAAVLHGDLQIVRDFTDVRDIVRGYRLLALKGHPGEVYNVGTGREQSLAGMLDTLRILADRPIEAAVDPSRLRPVDQRLLLADASKLRRDTGWQPLLSLKETLHDMLLAWRREFAAQTKAQN